MKTCWLFHTWRFHQRWTPPNHYGKIVTQVKSWLKCTQCGKIKEKMELNFDPITGDRIKGGTT